jgi:predicted PurR-regulated permease PerM
MSDSQPAGKFSPPKRVQSYTFGIILVILLLMVCRLFAPFFTALLWSTLLYILISPLHHFAIRKLDFSTTKGMILKNVWAAVFALGTIVIILIPLVFVASLFFRQIMDLLRFSRDIFSRRPEIIDELLDKISVFIKDISADQIYISGDEIRHRLLGLMSSGLQNAVSFSTTLTRNISRFFLGIVLMVFCLFFFFSDGPYLSRLVFRAIPIRREYIGVLKNKFMDITRNLFFGYIMVALIQALMAYIIFSIFRVQGSLVFAALTFICVFIPMLGGGLVWLPLGILRIISGDIAGGIIFLIVAGTFISLLDNVLRPMFLKDRIQLHPLVIFFAILGGVTTFGFNGIVLGPIVVIFFLTILNMFLTEHEIGTEI